jgi:serine protease inhibitor
MIRLSFRPAAFLVSLVFLLLMGSGCGERDPDVAELPDLRSLSPAERQVVGSSNAFAFDLLARVTQADAGQNVFVSPFSVSSALAMTANGAAGETKDAIMEALRLDGLSDDEMNVAYRDLVKFLFNLDRKVVLEVANSNWYRQEYSIKPAFRQVLADYYDAEIRAADFSDPATVGRINDWIEEKTHDKIRDMLDAIPANAVMYLINAIYFKADWTYRFDEKQTRPALFYVEGGVPVNADLMHSKGVKTQHYWSDRVRLVDLPYGNGQFRMTVLLPEGGATLQQLIDELDSERFEQFLSQADSLTAEVYLPKFRLEYKTELRDVLSDMGMGIAFTADADLSDLFVEALDLYISRVLHQSFVEVNEKGSEAAAATIVEIRETSTGGGSPPVIRIDRPFVFLIREQHSNTILFAGKMLNPVPN